MGVAELFPTPTNHKKWQTLVAEPRVPALVKFIIRYRTVTTSATRLTWLGLVYVIRVC